jgi:hypothetical protein
VTSPFPTEQIPGADLVYMRVHRRFIVVPGRIPPGCSKDAPNDGDGMSTDWAKYRAPEITQAAGAKDASAYAVIALNVQAIREIETDPKQTVIHDPLEDNRAHTLVYGPKGSAFPEIRVKFARISAFVIP